MKKLLALLFFFLLPLSKCSSSEDISASLAVETQSGSIGSFTANTLDGGSFTQDDIAAKDLTVINFWGTFCTPCIEEMPELAAFEKALPDRVQLITICVDAAGNEETAKELLRQAGYEGITITGGDDAFYKLLENVQAVPTTIFLNPEGQQVGEEILGRHPDLAKLYLSCINEALEESGKEEISLEE